MRSPAWIFTLASAFGTTLVSADPAVTLKDGDRVAFVGNTFLERENEFGCIETMLMRIHPGKKITFRNLAWSGDTVDVQMRPLNFGSIEQHLSELKPTLIIASYGMGESFEGEAGLPAFEKGLNGMLDTLAKVQPKIVLISPIKHESLGAPYPDAADHNRNIDRYVAAMEKIAGARDLDFVNLYRPPSRGGAPPLPPRLTENGIHLTATGYEWAARQISVQLNWGVVIAPEEFLPAAQVESLRQAVVEKNRLWFRRWRAHNGEYIYGRRSKAFPGNAGNDQFPAEIAALDKLIREADEKIWKLAVPVPHNYELTPEK